MEFNEVRALRQAGPRRLRVTVAGVIANRLLLAQSITTVTLSLRGPACRRAQSLLYIHKVYYPPFSQLNPNTFCPSSLVYSLSLFIFGKLIFSDQ